MPKLTDITPKTGIEVIQKQVDAIPKILDKITFLIEYRADLKMKSDISDKIVWANFKSKEYYLLQDINALIEKYEQLSKHQSTTGTDYGTLQFDKTTLEKIHVHFDDTGIWKSIGMDDFKDNFREIPKLSLKINDKPLFSYLFHYFKKSFINVGNKNKWMMEHFDIANFSKHKTLDYSNSDKATQLEEINVLLDEMGIRKK